MLPDLTDERAERDAARIAAAEGRKAGYRRARRNFKLFFLPFLAFALWLIYYCGYVAGSLAK